MDGASDTHRLPGNLRCIKFIRSTLPDLRLRLMLGEQRQLSALAVSHMCP